MYQEMNNMSNKINQSAHDMAKQMIIDGESFDTIMEKTNLRLKDLKRIQKNEIDPHFQRTKWLRHAPSEKYFKLTEKPQSCRSALWFF